MGFEESTPSQEEVGVKPNPKPGEQPPSAGKKRDLEKPTIEATNEETIEPEMEKLISIDVFPGKIRGVINEKIHQGRGILIKFQALKDKMVADEDNIQAELEKEIDETDPFASISRYASLSLYYDRLRELKIPYYDSDLACRELLELKAELLEIRAECRSLLGESTDSLAPDHLESSIAQLQERIAKEQEYINGQNVASHVTGYPGLVKILQNGSLAARSMQARSGEVVSTFQEKGRSEEHQIVFDMHTIRSSYARGKDKKGREDPIIILKRARDLMTKYQYLDADGRHFFGPNHNPEEKSYDPFVSKVSADDTVILVPETYRSDLVADLTETATSNDTTVEKYCEERGVVFISPEQYMIQEGVFAGKIFSGIQSSGEIGENDRKVVDGLLEIGKKRLYADSLPRIAGRIVPTGNTCEGAGGVMRKTYTFTILDRNQ